MDKTIVLRKIIVILEVSERIYLRFYGRILLKSQNFYAK